MYPRRMFIPNSMEHSIPVALLTNTVGEYIMLHVHYMSFLRCIGAFLTTKVVGEYIMLHVHLMSFL